MATKKPKKAMAANGVGQESDEEFLKRIVKMGEGASQEASEGMALYSQETAEFKAKGQQIGKDLAEIEECEGIVEEFKINPPILTTKHIGGVLVEYYYDEKAQKKIDLLKKHSFSFLSAVHGTSISPIVFSAFGNAYVKRGGKKVILPGSSSELPFIIRDGDIIGTEKRSFVLELKDELQNEDDNYWHIFIFPNSELKISISEKVSNSEPSYMDPSQVPEVIKKNSKSTVYTHSIEKIELLSGLFNIRVKKKDRDVNNIVKFTSGFPEVEFEQTGGLINEVIKDTIKKMGPKLEAIYMSKASGMADRIKSFDSKKGSDEINGFIELNSNGSVVIFATVNRVALKGSGRMTKKISTDMYNPVKITAVGGSLYETDGKTSPDNRISAIMKMWMTISQYIGVLNTKNENEYKQSGRSLAVENAKKIAEYVKTLGDKDMESAAKIILKNREEEVQKEKSIKELAADMESQKREARERLKFAEESGEPELIEVAKAQLKMAEGSPRIQEASGMTLEEFTKAQLKAAEEDNIVLLASPEEYVRMKLEFAERNLEKLRPQVEIELPSYSSPIASDAV